MQTQTINSFEEFNFKVPSQRKDIIRAFKSLMETFKITNESKQTNPSEREQMREDFFKYSGAFSGVFTDVDANDLRIKKALRQ